MSTCRTCEVAPLDCGTAITTYSLQEDTYFYETHCPPGSICNALDEMLMECCDGVVLRVVFPDDATAALRDAIMQALLAEYWKRQALCVTDGTADTTDGDPTNPDDPLQLYYNKYTKCTSYCSDGSPFTYIVLPGKFVGTTQEDVDSAAVSWACSQAKSHKICLSALKNSVGQVVTTGEAGTAFAAKITATGAYLSDISNTWLLVSGALPTGLSFPNDVGGKSLPIVGTPTTGGTYNFTIGIRAPNGDYQTKAYTVTITGKNLIAYFNCDEASPITTLDNSVADYDLDLALPATSGVSVVGKIDNSLRVDTVERIFTAATDDYWNPGTSFTVRFWIRTSSTNSIFNILTLWNDDGAFEIQGVFFGGQFRVSMECETVAGTESVSSAVIPLSQWNHVVCWFEHGVGLGIKVNDGAATTFATTSPLTLTAAHNFSLRLLHNLAAEPVDYEALDEIAIWGRKLTAAEITHDYNAGVGRTYPNVP